MFFPKPRDGSVKHFISSSRKKKNSVSLCDNYAHRVDSKTLSKFRTLTKLGGELRKLHLLESPTVECYITQYPIDCSNVVVSSSGSILPIKIHHRLCDCGGFFLCPRGVARHTVV